MSLTQEQFNKRMEELTMRDIEGNRYDFSQAIYKGHSIKVKVMCAVHGYFLSTPNNLKHNHGCPKCGAFKTSSKLSAESKKEFRIKASAVHNNKYDYSNSIYVDAHVKVEIICPVHGSFMQNPNNHLEGKGCRVCQQEAHTGENHPRWIKDRSLVTAGKRIGGIRVWIREVKKNRDYCNCCDIQFSLYTPHLTKISHHLNSYDSFPELRLEPSNGVCLCEACHRTFHHLYGYGKNTSGQYKEFKGLYQLNHSFMSRGVKDE